MPAIEELVLSNYVSPAIFVEAALLEFLTSGRFEPNLETVRDGLRIRRDAMLAALTREMPEGTAWNQPEGGYFLWLTCRGVAAETLLARAGEGGRRFIKADSSSTAAGRAARLAFSLPPHTTRASPAWGGRARSGCRCSLTAAVTAHLDGSDGRRRGRARDSPVRPFRNQAG